MKKIIVTLAFVLPACGILMPGLAPRAAKAQAAQNPVSGGSTLEYRGRPEDPDVASLTQADCERFPFEDAYAVHATAEQVCVEYTAVRAGQTSSESSTWFLLATDGNADAKDKPKIDLDRKGTPRKVALCKPQGREVGIWEVTYAGCGPNGGALTASSKRLELRNLGITGESAAAAWTF